MHVYIRYIYRAPARFCVLIIMRRCGKVQDERKKGEVGDLDFRTIVKELCYVAGVMSIGEIEVSDYRRGEWFRVTSVALL